MKRIPITSGEEGQIIITAEVNGQPVFLLLDGGAPSLLYMELRTAAALELPVVGQTALHLAHRGLMVNVPVYRVETLAVGELLFLDFHAVGVDSGRADGLLGMLAFRNQSFAVDRERREIRVGFGA